jgi:hypothetical protein
MKKSTLLLLLTILNFCFTYGQFKPNSIGICYLQQDTGNYYLLTIALPFQTLIDQSSKQILEFQKVIDSISYSGEVILFDKTGEIFRIENKDKFLLKFWCENDGGIQYRPMVNIKIKKTNFKRPLTGISQLQNICCFAIVDRVKQTTEVTDLPASADVNLMGDYDSDGKIDCLIWTDIDEARNCDSEPPNNLRIMLQVGKQYFRMRCCGP